MTGITNPCRWIGQKRRSMIATYATRQERSRHRERLLAPKEHYRRPFSWCILYRDVDKKPRHFSPPFISYSTLFLLRSCCRDKTNQRKGKGKRVKVQVKSGEDESNKKPSKTNKFTFFAQHLNSCYETHFVGILFVHIATLAESISVI